MFQCDVQEDDSFEKWPPGPVLPWQLVPLQLNKGKEIQSFWDLDFVLLWKWAEKELLLLGFILLWHDDRHIRFWLSLDTEQAGPRIDCYQVQTYFELRRLRQVKILDFLDYIKLRSWTS